MVAVCTTTMDASMNFYAPGELNVRPFSAFINAWRMRMRVIVLCLSVTSLLVSFHVYMTNYTYLPVFR